jgi:hypothetical protein
MRLHIELLAWFHVIWGVFIGLAGLSLGVLAVGSEAALTGPPALEAGGRAIAWLFAVAAASFVALAVINIAVGTALRRHRTAARVSALGLAVANLLVLPFGTALGVYTYWVLLNDDARSVFATRV